MPACPPDSTLDLGGNHLCYFAYVDKGVISGNTLSRPPFGRHALRLCGLSETQITNNVYISNNRISGWIDPIATGDAHNGGGKNYNWLLVHFAPNENSLKPAENIVFENNTVVDGQCLLNVGSAENVEIRDNLFSTVDASDVPRFLIGSIHGYDRKPSKNIRITGNLITSSSATSKSPILRISNYTGEAYNDQTQHEVLAFNGNTIFMANPQAAYLSVGAKTQPLLGAVSTDHNLLYRANDASAVLISPADYYKLAQWRLLSGNDVQSNVETTPQVPVPGFISAPRWISAGPLTVTYGAAQDFSGSGIKAVRLWAQRGDGLWFDTGLSSTHPEGTFTFQGFTGPDPYQFALAVEDHLGVTSFTPSGAGQLARTIYAGPPAVPDIMPPSTGTISAPAQATSGPIVISYAGAADNSGGSGLRQIRLWARKGLQGAWNDTGLYASSPTGAFSYEGMTGNDSYYFALRAVDNSGNTSPAPTGNGNASTVFEAPLPSATDKLLHLPMNDDPAQGARDVSSLAQNGICSGATAPASSPEGRFDAAYAFDGADDYIGVNHLAGHVSNAFSLTLWIKAPPIYMYASSASNRKGSLLGINSSTGANLFALYVGGNAASINNKLCVLDGGTNTFVAPTPVTVADDAWHFIAYTSDGSTGYVYVDGFLMSSHAVNYKLAASNQWSIGQEFDGTTMNHFFQGLMDEYAVWNRVLSQQEISLLFANAPAWVDTSILSAGTLTIPAFASGTSITLSYAGASGGSNGLKRVRLYVRKDSGSWVDTGQTQIASSGTFSYAPTGGDGRYYFAAVSEDHAGNASLSPSGNGSANTAYDASAPTVGGATSPDYARTSPITVSYTGASDAGGSGLKQVRLWVRKDAGSWLDTGQTNGASSGSFSYAASSGKGTYYFGVQAEDQAGNVSAAPSGSGSDATVYDDVLPVMGKTTPPAYANATPLVVSYSGSGDADSGLAEVRLWAKKGSGAWTDTGLTLGSGSGSFSYAASGAGAYAFALQATDKAGNKTAVPTGVGDGSTVLDTTAPSAGALTVPATASSVPITVSYSGVSDAGGSGLKQVTLWVLKAGATVWQDTGLSGTAASGTFSFSGFSGSGSYYFALQSEDKAGNLSASPSGQGQASTQYSATFVPGTATAPAYTKTSPITVSYAGASATATSVTLWVKKGTSGAWTSTGLTATGVSGTFSFSGFAGDDSYSFATQAQTAAGGKTATPAGSGDTTTVFDTTAPTGGKLTSPTFTRTVPFTVTYSGATDAGSGLKAVRLWVKVGFNGAWTDTGLSSTAETGSFSFTSTQTDIFFFYLQAEDNAGNKSSTPTDAIVFRKQ